jgi:hypothetical protein
MPEEKAAEIRIPFTKNVTGLFLLSGLTSNEKEISLLKDADEVVANKTFLGALLTELYKIQPKESRPFYEVFSFLASKVPKFDTGNTKLREAVAGAQPLRVAISELGQDKSIENIRKIAKKHQVDVFDINYTLAKAYGKDASE